MSKVVMSEKTHANVAVRLPEDLVCRLQEMQADFGARSIAPVIERLVTSSLDAGDDLTMLRQPLRVKRLNLSLRTKVVERLRGLAEDRRTEIGSVIYTLLAAQTPARASRPVRSSGEQVQAQAA